LKSEKFLRCSRAFALLIANLFNDNCEITRHG
jgi:hypothetical protein